jgi:hypothetical protein
MEATTAEDLPRGSTQRMAFEAGQGLSDLPAAFLSENVLHEDVAERRALQRQQRESGELPPGVLQSALRGLAESPTGFLEQRDYRYEDLPERSAQRLAFMGGRALGEVAPYVLVGGGLPASVSRGVGMLPAAAQTGPRQLLGSLAESFARDPRRYGQYELGAVAGAVHGRIGAEALFPGDEQAGYVGEVVGAIINPVGVGVGLFYSGNSAIRSLARMTARGQKADAATIVQQIAKNYNQNPREIAALIREGADLPVPVGAQINSPTLVAIQNTLASRNAGFRQATQSAVQDAYVQIHRQIDSLYAAGANNPNALRMAAKARQSHFENDLLEPMLDTARQRANTRIADMRNATTPQEAQQIQAEQSRIVSEELHNSLRQARTVEEELTNVGLNRLAAAGESLPSDWARRTSQIVDDISSQAIPGESSVDDIITRLYGNEIGPSLLNVLETDPSPRELWNLGKLAGKRAASLRASRQYEEAREYQNLRQAILDDVHSLDTPELESARVFSLALNETYRRSFARTAMPTTEAGQVALSPEQILDRAISPGGARAASNFSDLRDAVRFLESPESILRAETAGSSQEAYLRARASELVDPDTGRVNERRLSTFMDRNASVLAEFPELRDQLSSVREAELLLSRLVRQSDLISRQVVNTETFGRLINSEDPAKAVGQILQENPAQEMRNLAKLARTFGTDERQLIVGRRNPAVEGLKTAILDNVFASSRVGDGVSYSKVLKTLTTPLARDQDSLLDLMIKNRVISREESDRMLGMITRGLEVEIATNNATTLDDFNDLLPPMSMLTDLVSRGMGSVGATNAARRLGVLSGGNAGPSLIIARGGSKATQKLMGLDPQKKVFQIIMEAQTNPQLYAQLMEMPVNTPQQAANALRKVNGALYGAGLTPRFLEEEFEIIANEYYGIFGAELDDQ